MSPTAVLCSTEKRRKKRFTLFKDSLRFAGISVEHHFFCNKFAL